MATLKIENIHLRNGGNYIAVVKSKRGRSRDVYIDGELSKHLREFIEWKQSP